LQNIGLNQRHSRRGCTVVRFEIPMSEIQIMTFLNPLHDIADDFPDFSLRKMRLFLDISFLYEIRQVFLTKFHQNAILVVLDIHLAPPVEHSDHIWWIRHANSRNNFQFSPIHRPSGISHNLQRINLQIISQNLILGDYCLIVELWLVSNLHISMRSSFVRKRRGKFLPCKRLRKPLFRALPGSQTCSNDSPSNITDCRKICRDVRTPLLARYLYILARRIWRKRWRSKKKVGGLGVVCSDPPSRLLDAHLWKLKPYSVHQTLF